MERDLTSDLTKQYSALFKKKGVNKLYTFVQDVYRSGKLREISSFMVWEIFHQVGLFPKKNYLVFNEQAVIKLQGERVASLAFSDKVARTFANQGLDAQKCEHNWKLLTSNGAGEIFGCLYPNDHDLYTSTDQGKSVTFVHRFHERIKAIFISSQNTLFVCVRGGVYKCADDGASFKRVLDLGSAESFFRFNNAMTETPDKTLVIGEYGNIWDKTAWRKLAYLYWSVDGGETWKTSDFLIQQGTNKHIHIIKYSKLLNKLMMADGDNYKKLWLSDPVDSFDFDNPKWTPVNRFHIQMGGYTAVVESGGKIFFGTDYQGGTNFLVETSDGKNYTKKIVPDPYRRSPIDNMVLRKAKTGTEIWANLPFSTGNTQCLLMYSTDQGQSWNKVFEYSRATHTVWLLNSAHEAVEELYISVENTQSKERVVYKIADK